ncbi:hypothetical protein EGR_00795 [Echinococcus granulosus]|uniref:Uncharacterized protein n=1 Tax=Echinococcus granulosus TaxID=6210 RepID=W6UUB5_ECHGR|nr:hypothetical protein EGR_00795 [Echinococcus granulosus]EUB64251.1 hypothetical protein EGR_00795 [Echinococcus granulosus]
MPVRKITQVNVNGIRTTPPPPLLPLSPLPPNPPSPSQEFSRDQPSEHANALQANDGDNKCHLVMTPTAI